MKKVLNISNYPYHPKQELLNYYEFRNCLVDEVSKEDILWADILIGKIESKWLAYSQHIEWIQLESAGNDTLMNYPDANYILTNASGCFGIAISEYVIGAILALKRDFKHYHLKQLQHEWCVQPTIDNLYHNQALILGCGNLGQEIAKRLKAFDVTCVGCNQSGKLVEPFDVIIKEEQIIDYLPSSDLIILTLPLTSKTKYIMKKEYYGYCKKKAILVNVGRGALLKLDDLYQALINNQLKGAILDVFEHEPLASNHPIWDLNQVMITPHCSGTFHFPCAYDMYVNLLERNLLAYAQGKSLENIVDLKKEY